jgi:hypothetical protein
MSLGEMAYAVLYALHLIPVLLFQQVIQQKRQVPEPTKMPHGQLKAVPSRHCCFLFLFCLLLCALAGFYYLLIPP